MGICARISKDLIKNCDMMPVAGIEQRIVLINYDDLPKTGLSFSPTLKNSLITKLSLVAGSAGVLVEGMKSIMDYDNSLVKADDAEDGTQHKLTGLRLYDTSPEARDQINKLIGGAKVYAVVERKNKGTDYKDAFLLFGLTHGLELSDYKDSSKDANGCITFGLATPGKLVEPYLPHIYLDTDYKTSLTAFNNKFKA